MENILRTTQKRKLLNQCNFTHNLGFLQKQKIKGNKLSYYYQCEFDMLALSCSQFPLIHNRIYCLPCGRWVVASTQELHDDIMLDFYTCECKVTIININNGTKEHTHGYQSCNSNETLTCGGYKVRVSSSTWKS